MTGHEKPSSGRATWSIPEDGHSKSWPVIWLWSHGVADGAGHLAEHFDLLSQDCKHKGCMSMLGIRKISVFNRTSIVLMFFGQAGFRFLEEEPCERTKLTWWMENLFLRQNMGQ